MTLNIVSLGGLALGVGMLVDAQSLFWNIYRHRQEGKDRVAAAIDGASNSHGHYGFHRYHYGSLPAHCLCQGLTT